MKIVTSVRAFSEAAQRARATGDSVALVPTMGALHAGHRSLIERAVRECRWVAVTIFVNPLQFGNPEDLAKYPATLDADLDVCRSAGADVVFAPPVAEMYPNWPAPPATTVSVTGIAEGWEGASRPGHFDGVATVVAKLFSMTGACRAYFGEKDYQQLAVVRRMVADLSMPVTLVPCATVREEDGLALSSRNVRLGADERLAATVLSRALVAGRKAVNKGVDDPSAIAAMMASVVLTEPAVQLDYAAAVDAEDLTVPASLSGVGEIRLLIAAHVGPVRLIDNCAVELPAKPAVLDDVHPRTHCRSVLAGATVSGHSAAALQPSAGPN